jgi:RimJ/RimL family protein N-acetyltransferase
MKENLVGDRIYLTFPIGKVGAENIYQCMSNESTVKFMSSAPYPYTIEHAAMFLKFVETTEKDNSTFQLGIFNKENDSFVGMISLENINVDCKKCEIGFWISEKYVGKGIAKEASKLLIDFAFKKLDINKITAFAIKENTPSISLLINLGFEIEGLLRADVINKEQLVDRYAFGLLKSRYNG